MKRPLFLTIWLSLMTLSVVMSIYSYTLGTSSITQALPTMPSWALWAFLLISVAQLVAIVMLWRWQKMGFNISVGAAAVATIINIIVLGPSVGIFSTVFTLIGIGILYLAMKPVWTNFK